MTNPSSTMNTTAPLAPAIESESESIPIVCKPMASRYNRLGRSPANAKPSFGVDTTIPPTALHRIMANRGSLKAVHSSFCRNMESNLRQKKTKEVSFDEIDYGYGDAAPDDQDEKAPEKEPMPTSESRVVAGEDESDERASKRRRYQRRNSKTPAMLMAMNSPLLLHLDFFEDKKEEERKKNKNATTTTPVAPSPSIHRLPKDTWGGGLEIAEELVKHLQKRRQSQT